MKVFIIIPAYNEEVTLGQVLVDLIALYKEAILVVVIDGADDRTKEIVKSFSVICLEHFVNRGQGAALETGNEYARMCDADFVVHFDADGQHDPKDVEKLLMTLKHNDVDIVLGSRFQGKHNTPFVRRIFLRFAILFHWFFSGIFLTDAHNGLRAMNKKTLFCMNLQQDRMAHATEILSEIARHHLRYKEVPVTIRYTQSSQDRSHAQKTLSGSVRIIKDLVKKRVM